MSNSEAGTSTALVIEDDDQISYLVTYILRKEGYHVKAAADGRAAQALIESEPPPALVTLDFMLPYVDGLQLLAIIRSRPEWKHVPVIMLTARSQAKDVTRALEGGATAYLLKPFKPQELRSCIRDVLKQGPG